MHGENDEQIDYWNGQAGDRWARYQEVLDVALAPFGDAVSGRLRATAGERILDVGCGCGATTLALAERVGPSGEVWGVDVSAPMLARARARAAGRPNLHFVHADAAEHRFERPFDALFSRFGVMFFADPTRAFRRLRAALTPSGRLAFACWRAFAENPFCAAPFQRVRDLLPDAPLTMTTEGPGPFAFADRDLVLRLLGEAGFAGVQVEPFDADVVYSTTGVDRAVEFALAVGPTARALQDVPEATRERVLASLADMLIEYQQGDRIALPGAAWIVTAEAGG